MMSRRWRGQRIEHCHKPALVYRLHLPCPPIPPRPAVPACLDGEVPPGKKHSSASFACHPESSKEADSRQATRQLVRERSLGQG